MRKQNKDKFSFCHLVGEGARLQQINSRARVLSDRSEKTRERKLKKEKTICLTAWWYRMEKDERKFFRDVDKTEQARKEKMKGLESRRKNKENFGQKILSNQQQLTRWYTEPCPNLVTSAGNRRVGKMNTCISENFSAVRLNFDKNIFF